MTQPDDGGLADLLDPAGLASFAGADQQWFLTAAGQLIRDFCGWHIAPAIAVTGEQVEIEHGEILLPSLHVTSVDSLTVGDQVLTADDYDWDATGVIHLDRPCWLRHRWATVSYTHGYDVLPPDVAAVGYELTLQALNRPGANARDIGAGPYRVVLLKLGVTLDTDQKARLYSASVVRPQFA